MSYKEQVKSKKFDRLTAVFYLVTFSFFLSACSSQDDRDALFSDTEMAIIRTLVYKAPAGEASNAYVNNADAATLGQKFFWDVQFSGGIVVQGNRDANHTTDTPRKIACVNCHSPSLGWADSASKPNDVSLGANFTTRNSPTVLNASFNTYSLWDGSTDSVWAIARPAIEGNPQNFSRTGVAYAICASDNTGNRANYKAEYEAIFGNSDTAGGSTVCGILAVPGSGNNYGRTNYNGGTVAMTIGSVTMTLNGHGFQNGAPIVLSTTGALPTGFTAGTTYFIRATAPNTFELSATSGGAAITPTGTQSGTHTIAFASAIKTQLDRILANFGKAIGAYEHLLVSKNSLFDQWVAGNENALSASQKRGLKVFIGKGNCVRCHSGPNFSDGIFHNLGVPQVGGLSGGNDLGRHDGITTLVSGANSTFNTTSIHNSNASVNRVIGLSATEADKGKFKTPTLRSVNKTPPYFHNGTFSSLWDVVNFYNFAGNGGNFPGTKDTILTTRHMTNEEMEDLVNFLKALEGEALSDSLTKTNVPSTQIASW
jgi:cytochrome c peroxidase